MGRDSLPTFFYLFPSLSSSGAHRIIGAIIPLISCLTLFYVSGLIPSGFAVLRRLLGIRDMAWCNLSNLPKASTVAGG